MRTYTRKIQETMWAMGMPTHDNRFANLYRSALQCGLDTAQAFALVQDAYNASKGYDFQLAGEGQGVYADKCRLRLATIRRNAKEQPNGKCAEDLSAALENRPSRWGTPDFHRAS